MPLVDFITLISIPIVLMLGVITGIGQWFVVKRKIFWTVLGNLILLFVYRYWICQVGNYVALKELIPAHSFVSLNYCLILLPGILLFSLNCGFVYLLYKSSRQTQPKKNVEVALPLDPKTCRPAYLNLLFCWWIMTIVYLFPLYTSRKVERFDLTPLKIIEKADFINPDQLISGQTQFPDKNGEIHIAPYNYGGIIIHYDHKTIIVNLQTFFYRWKIASYSFDPTQKLILLKTGKDFFWYDITTDKLYLNP